jgi:hypothetical protein
MNPQLNAAELREVFMGFLDELQRRGPLRGFSGCGIVYGFAVRDPDWRCVLDAREPGTPNSAFVAYVDDPNAPAVTVEAFVDGTTLDKTFCGELHVRSAVSTGHVVFKGDQPWAFRLLPVLLNVVPIYRAHRAAFARQRHG